jgi:hypothetical protein
MFRELHFVNCSVTLDVRSCHPGNAERCPLLLIIWIRFLRATFKGQNTPFAAFVAVYLEDVCLPERNIPERPPRRRDLLELIMSFLSFYFVQRKEEVLPITQFKLGGVLSAGRPIENFH